MSTRAAEGVLLTGVGLLLQNLATVAANYRKAGIRLFVLGYFVRSLSEVGGERGMC